VKATRWMYPGIVSMGGTEEVTKAMVQYIKGKQTTKSKFIYKKRRVTAIFKDFEAAPIKDKEESELNPLMGIKVLDYPEYDKRDIPTSSQQCPSLVYVLWIWYKRRIESEAKRGRKMPGIRPQYQDRDKIQDPVVAA
jgi:hypothetical protein